MSKIGMDILSVIAQVFPGKLVVHSMNFIQKCGVSLAGYMGKAWSRVEGLNCLKFTHILKKVIKRLNIYANSMPNVNSI